MTSTEAREELGRAIYLALYEHQGAVWAANDAKEVWRAAADRLMASKAWLSLSPTVGGCPEGWVCVPREPTEAMIEAYCLAHSGLGFHAWANCSFVYPKMIAAAPLPDLSKGDRTDG